MILKEFRPPQDSPFWTGVWHYARGMAFTATGKLDEAIPELNRLRKIAAQTSLNRYRVTLSRNGAKAILEIATEVLAGELAAKQGDYDQAIARLHRGILLEDNLIYNEPPDWHVPVRQALGEVLLDAQPPRSGQGGTSQADRKKIPESLATGGRDFNGRALHG